jgi:REP element-mobilizing transposase RayT
MKYRKHLRLAPSLYRQSGYFFVTTVARMRLNLFVDDGKSIIADALHAIPNRFFGWSVDMQEIMPNHVHLIFLNQKTNNQFSLGDIMKAFKSLTYFKFKNRLNFRKKIWQPNYYERIIRSEYELYIVREYIKFNPEKERFDWNNISKCNVAARLHI